jgi:hypothetical protein
LQIRRFNPRIVGKRVCIPAGANKGLCNAIGFGKTLRHAFSLSLIVAIQLWETGVICNNA